MKVQKAYFLILFFPLVTFAENNSTPSVSVDNYFFRADYFSLHIPSGQDPLGLVGLHAAKQFDPGFYAGIGMYSAVAGQYSGFFALGGEAGWQHLIYRQLGFDTGLFVGAGGGKNLAQQIGNGSFVLPHIGLFYRFPHFDLGLNYSKIRFQSGNVNSQQVQLSLTWPFKLYTQSAPDTFDPNIPFAWSKNYLAAVASIYHPHDSKFTDGTPLTNNTELLGIEFGHFFTQHLYNFFEFTGAVHGNPNGYANLFAGLGWQQFFGQTHFFYSPRFALGSGGGGAYDTGGGLLMYPSFGLGWQFAQHWQAEILPGYVSSFGGHYHALAGEFQIKHDFDIATPSEGQTQSLSDFDSQDWRLRLGNQLYIKPQHENNLPNNNINLFALKIDKFMQPNWYLTGQTAFAYTGNAAGYFSGMLGAGYQTKAYHQFSLFGEGLVGTAGGAGLDIHDGALGQIGAGINYQWKPSVGAYTELSKIIAFKGSFHPTTVDLGVSYSFGLLSDIVPLSQ